MTILISHELLTLLIL